MSWLAIFLVFLVYLKPEIDMTEERVISFSLNNVIALITRVFLSATLSIPIFVIRGRWWTRQWKRISIGRKWSTRPGATHVAIVCGPDVDVMAPAPAQVPVPGGWPQFHSRYWRKHAGSTPRPRPPRLCWRSLLRQLIGSLLMDDQLSPDVGLNTWFVSLLLVVTRLNSKRLFDGQDEFHISFCFTSAQGSSKNKHGIETPKTQRLLSHFLIFLNSVSIYCSNILLWKKYVHLSFKAKVQIAK